MKTTFFSTSNRMIKGCVLALTFIVTVSSCKEKLPEPDNETELITTVTLQFQEVGTGTMIEATYQDKDGEGGNAPTKFNEIALKANKTYQVNLVLLDESKTPTVNISEEVLEEGEAHQVFIVPTGPKITATYNDKDAQNNPIGLKTTWTTGEKSSGKVRVTLKHQEGTKKPAPGDINAGETDVELDFVTKVE